LFIFACSKTNQKEHPAVPGPSGCLALLAFDGTLKTHRLLRFRQVQRLIPSNAAMLSGTELGSKNILARNMAEFFAISRRRAPKKLPEQEFGMSERSEFPNSR